MPTERQQSLADFVNWVNTNVTGDEKGEAQIFLDKSSPRTTRCKTTIQRQIDATDRRIDQLVYERYGLTDDEIRIVEDATRGG